MFHVVHVDNSEAIPAKHSAIHSEEALITFLKELVNNTNISQIFVFNGGTRLSITSGPYFRLIKQDNTVHDLFKIPELDATDNESGIIHLETINEQELTELLAQTRYTEDDIDNTDIGVKLKLHFDEEDNGDLPY